MVILQSGVNRSNLNSLPSPDRGSPSAQSLPANNLSRGELRRGMDQMFQRWKNVEAQKIQRLNEVEPYQKMRERKEFEELHRRYLENRRGKAEQKEQQQQQRNNGSSSASKSVAASSQPPSATTPAIVASPQHSVTYPANPTSQASVGCSSFVENTNRNKRKLNDDASWAGNPAAASLDSTERSASYNSFDNAKRGNIVAKCERQAPGYVASEANAIGVGASAFGCSISTPAVPSHENLTISCNMSNNDFFNLSADVPDALAEFVNNGQPLDDSTLNAALNEFFGSSSATPVNQHVSQEVPANFNSYLPGGASPKRELYPSNQYIHPTSQSSSYVQSGLSGHQQPYEQTQQQHYGQFPARSAAMPPAAYQNFTSDVHPPNSAVRGYTSSTNYASNAYQIPSHQQMQYYQHQQSHSVAATLSSSEQQQQAVQLLQHQNQQRQQLNQYYNVPSNFHGQQFFVQQQNAAGNFHRPSGAAAAPTNATQFNQGISQLQYPFQWNNQM